jgi:probable phosphoglycerate mutase
MTDFIFIRHGETDLNREPRFQGQIDVPLNATGLQQAARLAQALEASAPDAFVSSDLLRTRQTAAPLGAAWGRAPALHAGLREQAFGLFEGLDFTTIEARHPELWMRYLEHRADFALPEGGESARSFHARVLVAVGELAAEHAGRTIAVVTHGGVLDMLWRTARGEPLDGPRRCEIPNAGLNRMRWRSGVLEIVQWADTAHLAP